MSSNAQYDSDNGSRLYNRPQERKKVTRHATFEVQPTQPEIRPQCLTKAEVVETLQDPSWNSLRQSIFLVYLVFMVLLIIGVVVCLITQRPSCDVRDNCSLTPTSTKSWLSPLDADIEDYIIWVDAAKRGNGTLTWSLFQALGIRSLNCVRPQTLLYSSSDFSESCEEEHC